MENNNDQSNKVIVNKLHEKKGNINNTTTIIEKHGLKKEEYENIKKHLKNYKNIILGIQKMSKNTDFCQKWHFFKKSSFFKK